MPLRLLVAVGLLLALALAAPALSRAATPPGTSPIDLDAAQVQKGLFVAGDVARLSSPVGTEDLVLERVLQQMYSAQPDLRPATAESTIAALRSAYHAPTDATQLTIAPNERILSILAAMEDSHPSGAAATALHVLSARALIGSLRTGLDSDRFLASADSLGTLTWPGAEFDPRRVLDDTVAMAQSTPHFAQARDDLWQAASHESLGDSTQVLLADNPVLSALPADIKTLIDAGGEIHATLAQVQTIGQDDVLNAVYAVTAGATDTVEQVQDGSESPTDASKQAGSRDVTLVEVSGALSFVTKLVGFADPTLAKDLASAGKAAIGIAKAVNKFSSALTSLGKAFSAASALGAAAATGNLIGAISALAGLFGGGGPSPTQIILGAIHKLQSQIAAFQKDVNQRFEQIDGELNQIYGTMVSGLQSIYDKLAATSANVQGVFDGLTAVQTSLSRLQAHIYQLAKDASGRDLTAKIAYAVGYADRSGGTPLPKDKFLDAASFFYNWATSSAFDSVALGPTPRSFADGDVLNELSSYPLDSDVDYLSAFPAQRFGLAALSGQQLPNPGDWMVAARAYAELMAENPQYVTDSQRGRLNDLVGEGQELQDAIAAISVEDGDATGSGSKLLDAALGDYRDQAAGLVATLSAVEREYEGDLKGHTSVAFPGAAPVTTTPLKLDLWGGADQAPDHDPAIAAAYPCGSKGSGGKPPADGIALPSNDTVQKGVPNVWVNAMRLGLGDLSACYDAKYVDPRTWITVTPSMTITHETESIELDLHWELTPTGADAAKLISTGSYTKGGAVGCSTSEDRITGRVLSTDCNIPYPTPDDYIAKPPAGGGDDVWDSTMKTSFESDAKFTDGGNGGYAESQVGAALTSLQKGLYACMLNGCSLAAGSLAAGAPQQLATRLGGAQALITSYMALGFSRALETDDALRSLVYGSQRLMDGPLVTAFFSDAYAHPPKADPLVALQQDLLNPAALLQSSIAHYIARAHAGGGSALAESSDLVESTLRRLDLTRSVIAATASPPTGGGSGGGGSGTPAGGSGPGSGAAPPSGGPATPPVGNPVNPAPAPVPITPATPATPSGSATPPPHHPTTHRRKRRHGKHHRRPGHHGHHRRVHHGHHKRRHKHNHKAAKRRRHHHAAWAHHRKAVRHDRAG